MDKTFTVSYHDEFLGTKIKSRTYTISVSDGGSTSLTAYNHEAQCSCMTSVLNSIKFFSDRGYKIKIPKNFNFTWML